MASRLKRLSDRLEQAGHTWSTHTSTVPRLRSQREAVKIEAILVVTANGILVPMQLVSHSCKQ